MNAMDWLRNGPNVRMSTAYVDLVNAIFTWARVYKNSDNYESYAEVIRALSNYLLLKTHPYTGKPVQPDKLRAVARDSEKYRAICETTTRVLPGMIESVNGKKKDLRCVYPVLMRVLELCELGTFTGEDEDVALSILSLWHIDQTLDPRDRMTAQACISLYREHRANPVNANDIVYLHDKLLYISWITGEIDRLYTMEYTNADIYREVAYMGAFASLIRAVRIKGGKDQELNKYLEEEFELLMSKVKSC